jgi:hypothetical protein
VSAGIHVEHRRFDLNLTEIQARVSAGIENRRFDLNLTEIQARVSYGIEHRRFDLISSRDRPG